MTDDVHDVSPVHTSRHRTPSEETTTPEKEVNMTIRRYRSVALATVTVLSLVAASCGSDDEPAAEPAAEESAADEPAADEPAAEEPTAEEPAAEPSGEPFRIGIVAPSASNDLAFTQSIVDSVDRVGEGRDIEVAITDGTFVVEDAAAAIRGYADDGFDLVIAHGSQFGGPLQEIAPNFPDVAFAWGTAADTFDLPNVSAYTVRADEGGYVNGVIAAQITESNNLGVVGPVEVGDAQLYVDGFVAGVAAQNPDAKVNVNYIDSFSDVTLASEAAKALIGNGADVLTGTAQMVVGATGEATSAGVPWFGTQSNQTPLGEDIVVASQVYHWEVVLNELIDSIQGGSLGGSVYTLTLANGGLVMDFNDGYALDADIKASADATIAGLADGSIVTGIE
jgi:basic membrane protein A